VRLRAEAATRDAALYAVERMRFALCVDHDLARFNRRFKDDRLLGPIIRRRPWIRPTRHGDPFQALAWAITEQLIEVERAEAIQRRLVWRFGRRRDGWPLKDRPPSGAHGNRQTPGTPPDRGSPAALRDAPAPGALAARSPAELEACDLTAARALAIIRAAHEVASGRVDLLARDRATIEAGWRRLRSLPTIGLWTIEKLAYHGQGLDDELPAGDLAYLKLVGRLERLDRRASVEEVREFLAPYAPFRALAGTYLSMSHGFPAALSVAGHSSSRRWHQP